MPHWNPWLRRAARRLHLSIDNLANVAGAQSRGWQAHHHQSIPETRQFLASIGLL
ncbi:MAG: hypothetical protein LR011_07815 [Verrucomicrobia bacterium]|nr:hypothetical protein [Verrucomicrobiota bacterium]